MVEAVTQCRTQQQMTAIGRSETVARMLTEGLLYIA
jgi:hypothetical protein